MANAVRLLPFLLVLAVSIQVSYSCTCEPITFEKAMSNSETVVMAYVEEKILFDGNNNTVFVESMAAFAVYQMYLEHSYKNGSEPLFKDNKPFFNVVAPWKTLNCGIDLVEDSTYILSGKIDRF
ncbi:hypothetical protein CHS0354_030494 [Potamilus streckersoni]|uniref:Uncharacterized protein n=1 Tax=Potamilus streckersoni TaxID=2493646 RepID=A0AAE0RPJ1_9BIVA|nr:hypothetical protein CHS0354_030494 [Potamilus streckersoni]